jgi:hypothetical protein
MLGAGWCFLLVGSYRLTEKVERREVAQMSLHLHCDAVDGFPYRTILDMKAVQESRRWLWHNVRPQDQIIIECDFALGFSCFEVLHLSSNKDIVQRISRCFGVVKSTIQDLIATVSQNPSVGANL